MKTNKPTWIPIVILIILIITDMSCRNEIKTKSVKTSDADSPQLTYNLSLPQAKGSLSVEEALATRRSHRSFQDTEVSEETLSQILWSAYGITKQQTGYPFMRGGLRTAPSAGALYPLEVYVLAGRVAGIEPGVYRYISDGHKIVRINQKDVRKDLCEAALNQKMIMDAPMVLFYSAVYSRTTGKYGVRGRERYVCMDLGYSSENVYLQAEALHLGTCAIGAFNDDMVRKIMQLPDEEEPLLIMPVGYYYNVSEF